MKRIMLFCLLLTLAFSWTLPAHADLSQEEIYVALQEQLHDRLYGVENVLSFESLAQQFTQLGSYKKSAQYRYYTSILADTEAGYYGSLSRNFRLLRLDAAFCEQLAEEGLPTVDELEAYTQGRQAEASGDWASAVACYERSIAVLDSLVRLDALLYEHANLLQEGLVVGDYKIDTYDNGTCVIQKYTGTTADLTIPRVIGGYQVRGIGNAAFRNNEYLTSVVIPEGVTSISGDDAFGGCSALKSISIPASVSSIGQTPLWGCPSLEDIHVASGNSVFETIDGVLINKVEKKLICCPAQFPQESYTVPDGIEIIDFEAFTYSRYLKNIVLPEGVQTIGNAAFGFSPSLTSITIPDSASIPRDMNGCVIANPFVGCTALVDICVSPSHPELETIDGVLFNKIENRLICYPAGLSAESYTVPYGVEEISWDAFTGCSLVNIVLPDTVTQLYGTQSCPNLASITIPSSVSNIGGTLKTFYDCPNLTLRVQEGSRAQGYAESWNIPYEIY